MGLKITVLDLQELSRTTLLDARNLDRIVQSESFSEAWEKANNTQKKAIELCVATVSPEQLKVLLNEICLDGYYAITVAKLRTLASYYRIPNYSRMPKETLIKELEKHENS